MTSLMREQRSLRRRAGLRAPPRLPHALLGIALGLATVVAARRRQRSFAGRTVLVTGGSRGLGLELAREFGRRGARVAICARDAETLDRARVDLERRDIAVCAMAVDVREANAVAGAVRSVVERWGALDVLVNNAGVITVGPLETMTLADFDDAIRTTFGGALHATQAALPLMRARGEGHIVNIVSVGGKIPVPHLLPYVAGKFALAGFSEGLAAEVRPWGIAVTTVYPGLMRTGSPRHALFKGDHRAEYAWFSIADAIPGLAMHVERAARRIADACARRAPVLTLTVPARVAIAFHAVAPGTTSRLLSLVTRLLPVASGHGTRAVRGRDSETEWSRSALTRPSQRAEQTQNQA
jgi:NAD(P)-dependent dehydrogenase (short-subunit alcohol dehydrogenase family)